MAQEPAKSAEEQVVEYSIFVTHKKNSKNGSGTEMVGQPTNNMKDAVKQAEDLHASGEYAKVEVKQKYFDPKNNREINMSLKVLETKEKKPISLLMLILFTIFCGGAAFGLTVLIVGKPAPAEAESAEEHAEESHAEDAHGEESHEEEAHH